MDDKEEKSMVGKVVDKIGDVVESIANTASNAAVLETVPGNQRGRR